jgi:hypothetical protein
MKYSLLLETGPFKQKNALIFRSDSLLHILLKSNKVSQAVQLHGNRGA